MIRRKTVIIAIVADRTMRSLLIIQHGARTPMGLKFASFYIRGILGPGGSFTSMRYWPKGRIFSVQPFWCFF